MSERRDPISLLLDNRTALSDFGHSCAGVPDWLHIGAYPHAFPNCSRLPRCYEIPANAHIRYQPGSEMGLIAMQKVVGSNPISRFFENPLHVVGLVPALPAEQDRTIPAYCLHSRH